MQKEKIRSEFTQLMKLNSQHIVYRRIFKYLAKTKVTQHMKGYSRTVISGHTPFQKVSVMRNGYQLKAKKKNKRKE